VRTRGPVRTIDVRITPLDMTQEAITLLRRADVAESVCVLAGGQRTPNGLLVAARWCFPLARSSH
jgi:hypothetical protein